MRFKKVKIVLLLLVALLIVILITNTCKRAHALSYDLYEESHEITYLDQSKLGLSSVYLLAPSPNSIYFLERITSNYTPDQSIYLTYGYTGSGMTGILYINYTDGTNSYNIDSIWPHTPFIIISIYRQNNELYLIIDEIEPSFINVAPPELDYLEYSQLYILALEDYGFVSDYYDHSLSVNLGLTSNPAKCLIQSYYIEFGDTMNSVYNECENCINNQYFNTYLAYGYDYGYDNGYDLGERNGYAEGFRLGHADGYTEGYADGEAGETAVSRAVTLIGSIFTAIGSIMSIELFPNVPMGLFFLVPLFFAVVGLILWIWRKTG